MEVCATFHCIILMYLYIGCGSGLDIVFVLDASTSIGSSDFLEMKDFVKSIVSNFEIGADKTCVGVIRFASSASIVIPLALEKLICFCSMKHLETF